MEYTHNSNGFVSGEEANQYKKEIIRRLKKINTIREALKNEIEEYVNLDFNKAVNHVHYNSEIPESEKFRINEIGINDLRFIEQIIDINSFNQIQNEINYTEEKMKKVENIVFTDDIIIRDLSDKYGDIPTQDDMKNAINLIRKAFREKYNTRAGLKNSYDIYGYGMVDNKIIKRAFSLDIDSYYVEKNTLKIVDFAYRNNLVNMYIKTNMNDNTSFQWKNTKTKIWETPDKEKAKLYKTIKSFQKL